MMNGSYRSLSNARINEFQMLNGAVKELARKKIESFLEPKAIY